MIPRRTFRPVPVAAPKPFLYPRGTTLAEIPALARGLTWMEYLDHCIAETKKQMAAASQVEQPAPPVEVPAFGTQRRRK
jgi:hypothetical protein